MGASPRLPDGRLMETTVIGGGAQSLQVYKAQPLTIANSGGRMVLGWDTWLYLEEDSLRRQLLIWIESVAYGHCPELGPQTLRGGG